MAAPPRLPFRRERAAASRASSTSRRDACSASAGRPDSCAFCRRADAPASRPYKPVVYQYVDEAIIGGLVLRVQDKLIDASVRFQLESMRKRLLEAAPR